MEQPLTRNTLLLGLLLAAGAARADAPALPAGLDAPAVPALPLGMEASPAVRAVAPVETGRVLPEAMSGFWELRAGTRLRSDPEEQTASIGETRLQIRFDQDGDRAAFRVVADLLYDPVLDDHTADLETGDGWLDLRQANLLLRPAPFMDAKFGRQINTWGVGDLLFVNDLFPKDWNAFFIGRDDEYLKAPSDAAKVALFGDWANLDIVYTPRFDSDRFIDGRRVSYWNSGLGRLAGRDAVVGADKPDETFRDDEWAARIYRTLGGYEAALYAYDGFWKSPAGTDGETGEATFPRLQVCGASVRGPIGRGIASIEGGWYRSGDDLDGDDPLVRNSEARFLAGYEQELMRDLIGGVQYYVESMLDYGAYRRALPEGIPAADEHRQVVTARLTKLLLNQNLRAGLFMYWSPTEKDLYLRPNVNYKLDDHWVAELGGNVFVGEEDYTFFGQFERNSNIYASVRYGF